MELRLARTALRNLSDRPEDQDASARVLLLNAMRIAVKHVGKRGAAELALKALSEGGAE